MASRDPSDSPHDDDRERTCEDPDSVDFVIPPDDWDVAEEQTLPESIGPYRVARVLGEGGMGVVFEAEQLHPVRRRVALKLIKQGMDTEQVLARFDAERQALALMNHPSIARVLDAGANEHGRPFFAMEFVEGGSPIIGYCDRAKLPIAERLELFAKVCDGVQHAHQKGIIHRDLKPSNVLVTLQDGVPTPKIIDFGIAKATAQPLTDRSMHTQMGAILGTPEYMSPEQADLTSLDVDTRTDVYSLGVMLYELLVGALPFDPEALRRAGFLEILRTIREDEPPRPSARLTSMGAESSKHAGRLKTDRGALTRQLRGDLDWITMKALEKDPHRRYSSPSELAADVRRHLRDEPVLASPPTFAYRAGKFVRRHRVGVAASSVVLVALVASAILSTAGFVSAKREAALSQNVSEFLVDLFEGSDPRRARGRSVTAREILDAGATRIRAELDGQPVVQARMMVRIGRVYRSLGLYDDALPLLQEARTILERLRSEKDADVLEASHYLALLYTSTGDYLEAEKLFDSVLQTRRRKLGADDPATLQTMSRLAELYDEMGYFDKAELLFLDAIERYRRVLGETARETLLSQNSLAGLYVEMGRFDEAEPLYETTLTDQTGTLGDDHPDTLQTMLDIAGLARERTQFDVAEMRYRKTLEFRRRVLGDEHRDTLIARHGIALCYYGQERYAEAARVHEQVLEIQERVLGEDHPDTLASVLGLGDAYVATGDFAAAEALYARALTSQAQTLGQGHPDIAATLNNHAILYRVQGRSEDAAALYARAREILEARLPADHPKILRVENNLGNQYFFAGRYDDAEAIYRVVLEKFKASYGAKNGLTLQVMFNITCVLAIQDRVEEALAMLEDAASLGLDKQDWLDDEALGSLHADPRFESIRRQVGRNAETRAGG